jgi:hypothetical protein
MWIAHHSSDHFIHYMVRQMTCHNGKQMRLTLRLCQSVNCIVGKFGTQAVAGEVFAVPA